MCNSPVYEVRGKETTSYQTLREVSRGLYFGPLVVHVDRTGRRKHGQPFFERVDFGKKFPINSVSAVNLLADRTRPKSTGLCCKTAAHRIERAEAFFRL